MPANIIETFKQKTNQLDYLKAQLQQKQTTFETITKEVAEDNLIIDEISNILLATKLMLEKITHQNKAKIEEFITYALQRIFTDRDYRIELEIKEDVKRPALTIMLIENGVKQDIKDSVGGGIITTLGFLFQIYYLEVYNKNKVMFIDEGLKEVSKVGEDEDSVNYLNNLLNFLKWLSTEKGYKFVIVTHDETLREVADNLYRVKLGEVTKINLDSAN